MTAPHTIHMRDMDAKIGGADIDRLRRWFRQGKLTRSRGFSASRFPRTPSPGSVDRLIHRGVLRNARFAAAVVVTGIKSGRPLTVRSDVSMPSLVTLYRRRHLVTPIAWATAHMMALFIKHFPRESLGVQTPETLPAAVRRAILRDARRRGFTIVSRVESVATRR